MNKSQEEIVAEEWAWDYLGDMGRPQRDYEPLIDAYLAGQKSRGVEWKKFDKENCPTNWGHYLVNTQEVHEYWSEVSASKTERHEVRKTDIINTIHYCNSLGDYGRENITFYAEITPPKNEGE